LIAGAKIERNMVFTNFRRFFLKNKLFKIPTGGEMEERRRNFIFFMVKQAPFYTFAKCCSGGIKKRRHAQSGKNNTHLKSGKCF